MMDYIKFMNSKSFKYLIFTPLVLQLILVVLFMGTSIPPVGLLMMTLLWSFLCLCIVLFRLTKELIRVSLLLNDVVSKTDTQETKLVNSAMVSQSFQGENLVKMPPNALGSLINYAKMLKYLVMFFLIYVIGYSVMDFFDIHNKTYPHVMSSFKPLPVFVVFGCLFYWYLGKILRILKDAKKEQENQSEPNIDLK